ncbi:MAG: EamA family transporter [Bacteroidetes bacterium]|nr:EamA family transporter [Bacteroidota bacterium]
MALVYILVLIAAGLHAFWNFLAKTIPSGAPFVWLMALCSSIILLPAVLWYAINYGLPTDTKSLVFIVGSAIFHLVYFLILQQGYQKADLSVVYPLARGTGPLFSTVGAVIFLSEKLTGLGILGLSLVLLGIILVVGFTNKSWRNERNQIGIRYGLVIGLLIASYTVWDGYAVKVLAISPILVEYFSHPFRVLALTKTSVRQWPEVRFIWKKYWLKILAISTLGPLGFILVLYAMQTAPVHFVAPARELSIVFGVLFGGKLLAEEHYRTRLAGAFLMLVGIGMIAWQHR